jgi:hypothetical protein
MADTFKQTRRNDWHTSDPDLQGMGHTKQRNAYRRKQNRRTRRVLKQELKKELW